MTYDTNLAEAIEAIAALAQKESLPLSDRVSFENLPDTIVPKGATANEIYVAIKVRPSGEAEITSIKSLIDEYRSKPVRRGGTAHVTTLESFVNLVNRHKGTNSAIFANISWKNPVFTAILDYHHANSVRANTDGKETSINLDTDLGDDPLARFGRHQIKYKFPLSEGWKACVEANGKNHSQSEFAQFLEDHIHEIASPAALEVAEWEEKFRTKFATPNHLIDLARGLEVNVEANIKSKIKLASGETQIVFDTQHKDAAGKEIIVPGLFMLAIAPFHRGEEIRIPVRLRYRVTGEGIAWSYLLFRPDQFIDARLADDCDAVAGQTNLPVYAGEAEMDEKGQG